MKDSIQEILKECISKQKSKKLNYSWPQKKNQIAGLRTSI